MQKDERKAAVAAYKERKSVAGVYGVRCAASGEAWVGQSRNLEQAPNRLWFTLRQGVHRTRTLQDAYRERGEDAFVFEVLERAEDDEPAYALDSFLKDRLAHWREKLGAGLL